MNGLKTTTLLCLMAALTLNGCSLWQTRGQLRGAGVTKPVLFEKQPSCSRANLKDMLCQKEWARFDAYEIINKGDANARIRRVAEGQ